MNTIKKILFIICLCIFIALLVILLLLPSKAYDQISDNLFNNHSQEKSAVTHKSKPKLPIAGRPIETLQQVPSPSTEQRSSANTPIQMIEGFDWRLPPYTTPTRLSGLISETNALNEHIRADFHMVRWDKTNPQQNVYDFSELENTIRSRPQQQVALRLETYGKCEAPSWALQKLQTTPDGSIIFWQDRYIDVLKPYIKEVAKLVDRHPQIVGVQIGISDGQYRGDCSDFSLKDGWGEFNLKPEELRVAQTQYGLTPELLERSAKRIVDMYADEFGRNTSKLIFNNFDQFSWQDIATPYNAKMIPIAKYALSRGIGNRDGQIEHWMRYTQKIYGMGVTPSTNGTCALEMNEQFAKRYTTNRYWGTENEEFGDFYWVKDVYGSVSNQAHRFFASSLRALQMRRNYMSIHGEAMQKARDPIYKTQDFIRYLDKTLGKQISDTPDAFILLGERYVANFRLAEFPEVQRCQVQGGAAFRSYGRWISEKSDSQPAMRIALPTNDKRWGQGFYLPQTIDYEYAARSGKQFSFDLNDELSQARCSNGCNVEVKVTYKDDHISNIWLETAEGRSGALKTVGDSRIKTATFTIHSKLSNSVANQDLLLKSDSSPLSVILLRINFLSP